MSEPNLHVVRGDEEKKSAIRIDGVTLAHAAVGGVLGVAGAPWWVPLAMGAGAQLSGYMLDRDRPKPNADQVANKVIDASTLLGVWALARAARGRVVRAGNAWALSSSDETEEPDELPAAGEEYDDDQ